MDQIRMIEEIKQLKEEKNAIILAHNYQIPEVQDIADVVGDSLKLSQVAAETNHDMIIFCGVHFMAESAKILSPEKKVILPVLEAGCPMADMVTGEDLAEFKEKNPGVPVVTYVNSSADVKAQSDICCTSSNAVKVVESLGAKKILFAPDRNLGHWVQQKVPGTEIMRWDGFCITHERVNLREVEASRQLRPGTPILVHPECNPAVVEQADFVGSTAQIIEHVKNSDEKSFIIGTEMGILHTLRKLCPDKHFRVLSGHLTCYNMKKTGLENVYNAIKNETYEITVDEDVRKKAFNALDRMLKVTK
ncbi:quinolinate synthase NadA [Fusibacter sp. JL216-2]|uniref:quinolinate synthase NadA n=1 Tax=Fusibacter sp. JL216-2 TaxID=3071453 RepID=UPI003D343AFD